MWEKKDITDSLERLVNSPVFADLEAVIDDLARTKFLDVQTNADTKTHSDLLADRKILNFYLNLSRDLKFRLASANRDIEAKTREKLEASERVE